MTMDSAPRFSGLRRGHEYVLIVGGVWRMDAAPPESGALLGDLDDPSLRALRLETRDLETWDASLLAFLARAARHARARSLSVVEDDLPHGLRRLLRMASAAPPRNGVRRPPARPPLLERLGGAALRMPEAARDVLSFAGDMLLSLRRLCGGRSDMRAGDMFAAMRECGADSLPVISLSSLLFGLILAFVGAVQLTQFGAQRYVAGLVGIGMLRVMGAVMVGVVMAGRVGAAYAAFIGAMRVNEEVDALETLGMSPVDFLVLPRVLALTLMAPLLTLYADFMGLLGGFLVGVTILGLNPLEYYNATVEMTPFRHVLIGLVYGTVFGVVVAASGCRQGLRCGRSAAAVGMATTAAVVNAIVGVIVSTAIITVICNMLGV